MEAPPDAPVAYLDVEVTHPCAPAYCAQAALELGHAAQAAAAAKHTRYPPHRVRGRLVPFAVETYGRLRDEALSFLRKADRRACRRTTALAVLGGEGPPAALGA